MTGVQIHIARLFSLLLLFTCYELNAQFYPARTYSLSDGMPANAIYDILQMEDGTMWFSSSKGIFTYNGSEWYLFPDSLNLPNSASSRMRLGQDGVVWLAGQNSNGFTIRYFKEGKWQKFEVPHLILPIPFRFNFDVFESIDNSTKLLIGDANALFVVDVSTQDFEVYKLDDNVIINDISCSDVAYISTSNGVYTYESGILNPLVAVNSNLPETFILACTPHQNELYFLGRDWIYKRNDENHLEAVATDLQLEASNKFLKHNLAIDPLGRIFFSSNTPAMYYDQGNGTIHTLFVDGRYLNALSNKIFIDRENNVWVGDHRGLFKFNLLRFLNFNKNTQLTSDEVSAIFELDTKIILANVNALNILEKDKLFKTIELPLLPDLRILDIAQIDDQIFVATHIGGLLNLRSNSVSKNLHLNQYGETGVNTVEEFRGQLYYSTNLAVYKVEGGSKRKVFDISGIRNLQRTSPDSLLAFTTSNGVHLLDEENPQHFTSTNRKFNSVYSAITWRNQLLLATEGGLATLDGNEIVQIDGFDELNLVSAYCFTIDFKDRLWIGTNEGVFVWDGSRMRNYTQRDGLVGNEVNRNALVTDKFGRVWIGTELGASVYNSNEDVVYDLKPSIQIKNVKSQNGTVVKAGDELDVNDNTLKFTFLGISFFDEEQITYRYRLIGFDLNWNYSNKNNREARYTNLPPGAYSFEVQAGIANDNWSESKMIDFSIDQSVFTKNWFLTLALLTVLAALYIIYRVRFFLILKNQELLKQRVTERTREIAKKNKEIESQNEELKQQSEEIVSINERLEEIVKERTGKLIEQNKRLIKYTFINSHKLRAPICRIVGLIYLINKLDSPEDRKYIIEQLTNSSHELDEISKEINHLLEEVITDDDENLEIDQ